MPIEGILGLARGDSRKRSFLKQNGFSNFLNSIILKKIFEFNLFAFDFVNTRNSLIFGNLHSQYLKRKKEEFNFVDIYEYEKKLWIIKTEGIFINDKIICADCTIIFDSGTSFYSTSYEIQQMIKIHSRFDSLCQNYDSVPEIKVKLKRSIYTSDDIHKYNQTFDLILNREDYITKRELNIDISDINEILKINKCDFDIFVNKNLENTIIFGIKFMKSYYTIFDFERNIIGLIRIRSNSKFKQEDDNKYQNTNTNSYDSYLKYSDLIIKSEINSLIEDWKRVY